MRASDTRAAFSLIEVLLALALLAGVSGAALGLLSGMGMRQDHARTHSDRLLESGLVFDHLERALLTSYAVGSDGRAGIVGDSDSVSVLSRGVVGHASEGAGDQRSFGVHWARAERRLELAFGGGGDPETETLDAAVELVRFRYFAGNRWRTSFDSAQHGGLPGAVEMSIWFGRQQETQDDEDPGVEPWIEDIGDVLQAEQPIILPERAPDRVRIIAIPDASDSTWGEPG